MTTDSKIMYSATIDNSYSGSEGVRELLEKVNEQGIVSDYRLLEEKKLVKKFMSQVYSDHGLSCLWYS